MIGLVIIPARGGSKGIPGKNTKPLNGKPLILYSIEIAQEFFKNEDICVSTDSSEIISVVEDSGLRIPFIRPAQLATDSAGTYEVLLHAIEHYEKVGKQYDYLILLQPTSPLRTKANLKEALKLFNDEPGLDMVVSVKETASNPYYVLFEEDDSGFLKKSKSGDFVRRQDCPKVWEYNGALYIINIDSLKKKSISEFDKIKKYVMSEECSVDLDTPFDWLIAEELLKQKGQ